MGKFDKDSIIKFVKTNSVDFAAEFPWFNEWLRKNASKIIEWEKRSILRPNRNPVIPSFPEGTPVAVLNRTYFLDDIKTVFFRGIRKISLQGQISQTVQYSVSTLLRGHF